jgi:putative membrane protein
MMQRLILRPLAVALALAGYATGASAQQPGTRVTRDFVQAAAQTDEFEILEATTALAQSQDQQVRAFAQAMIQAHGETTESLKTAVAKAGLDQPKPGISGDQSSFLASLQSMRGADFDKAYIRQQTLVHHAALAVIQAYATSGDDATIRQAAAATVPIVASHLEMLARMAGGANGSQ